MSRWIRFFIVLGIGFGIGLLYGWVIDPVEYVDTNPESMRNDYTTDYVLMVAEAYQGDQDASIAIQRLSFLEGSFPVKMVEDALVFAVQSGYAPADLGLLRELSDALEVGTTSNMENQP